MTRRAIAPLSRQHGFTLTELLLGSTMMLILLTATLTLFANFERTNRVNNSQNESQDANRNAVDGLARDLRNIAGPDNGQPEGLDKATPYDLVFKTIDPNGPNTGSNAANVRRVRYCLDTSTASNGKLWMQTQTWTSPAAPAVPSTASCPDGGWGNQQVLSQNIVNRISGQDRPFFLFAAGDTPISSADSTTLAQINAVRMDVYVRARPNEPRPGESRLQSGVFLRNQNRPPAASFTPTPAGTSGHVLLNGSASSDPEGETLTYTWKEGSTKIGDGIVYDWGTTSGSHSVTLEVRDPAGLVATTTQTVTVS